MLYFVRDAGQLNGEVVGQMVKVGRVKLLPGQRLQVNKAMSDLQILVKRRGLSARDGSSHGGVLPRTTGTPEDAPRQPRGSLMSCHKQLKYAEPSFSRQRDSEAFDSRRYLKRDMHPQFESAQLKQLRPMSARPLSARLEAI
eukprot:9478955-Pyramimonas_sp.AAC.1